MATKHGCIVVFDNDELVLPMGWDSDCDGAICVTSAEPAWFPDAAAARQAIRISTAFARLRIAQGKPANTDFTEAAKYIKVKPLIGGGT